MIIVPKNVRKLFIDFDGSQIEVCTDIPDVLELFERMYRPMLVRRLTSRAGRIEILETRGGYTIHGLEKTKFRRMPLESFVDFLKHDVLLQFMKARPDLLWMHAAAVERDGSALLIVGASAQGKSTFATRLCETGWRLLSDDVAPIRMDVDEVLPFPQSAYRRIYPGSAVAPEETGSLVKEEVSIPDTSLHVDRAIIKAIVFPRFKNGAAPELRQLSAGEGALEILRNCFNFADHKATAVARVSRLASAIPIYHLSYGDGHIAVGLLDALVSPSAKKL